MRDQEKKIEKERNNEKAKELWKDMDMVFPSTIGTPVDPTNILKKLRQVLNKAGLPRLRFHDLRHTAASIMLNNGVEILVASKRLGHAKPSITLDVYGHLFAGTQKEVAGIIEELISR